MTSNSEVDSRLNSILIPSLNQIISTSSWLSSSPLVDQSKSLLSQLTTTAAATTTATSPESDFSLILSPFLDAAASSNAKIVHAGITAFQKLISHGYLIGEVDSDESTLLYRVIDSVCGVSYADESIELLVIRTLLTAVTSTSIRIHGDCLLRIVRTCYDIYLGSKNVVNQTTAKASLIQMLVIVFRRMEADSETVPVMPIVVADMMEPFEVSGGDSGVIVQVQGIITRIMSDFDGVISVVNGGVEKDNGGVVHDGAFETKIDSSVEGANTAGLLDSSDKDMLDAKYWEISMYKTALEGRKGELDDGENERDDDLEVQIGNKLRRDAFLVFRALCKLSMKTVPKEVVNDPNLMRGKIIALELLKILLENAGAIFRTSDRFLGAIKQYLCLSLLKNSASTLVIVFQFSCSIFMSLVARFRAGLKAEIGVFFPMIALRVLENVSQPNFQQKIIVLRFLEKLSDDSQILVDIFLNYDCDVNSSNIFERVVNGLLKTALGVPPGATTTLLPHQEATLKFEALKCLVAILKSMSGWVNPQLCIPDPHSAKNLELMAEMSPEGGSPRLADGTGFEPPQGCDSHSEYSNDASDVQTIEQRRAYKLELQEGISLFNRRPKKGIEFLINANKVGSSPEEVAAFLKDSSDLDKTMIGDFLGEREDMPLKVMHAYVDSFEFQGMDLDEAIRMFLQGFRLPGEAQKIDRIMEKFAERYWKCNATAFSSADTAYVLAYSVILLNTDAHNPMVKNKMSAEGFIRNNRGIDDGKDLPEEYMKSLYERITKNEIKLKDDLASQPKQSLNNNRILSLDSILNIVAPKRDESYMESSDSLIRHKQEQFKEKARKSESAYYAATDAVILRFMFDVCWAPMLAAFSVALDQTEDEVIIELCLEGFRCAIHITSVMSMKTHRDAFVTSLAKFTSLHSPADIKQKNIYVIKAIVIVADEDGNYLQEAWEHILTCVSRFEHLHLLGEGAPPDAAFFAIHQNDQEKSKQAKSKKGPGKMQYAASAVRSGSYDSASIGGNGSVTTQQVFNLVSNLNLLEQVGSGEMSRIFIRSQKLNSEAIVDFVKALCKVSMGELRSASDPRVFSLTKIVEIAHYNMNRIRLVWSSIWHVLADFFVTIGCSENLSIAIFAMDSLRQLSMKFLEREELANYNFQNEFMNPFAVVMMKSNAVEIRELIIRCVSQMVLSRVNNVKSGWKSMFMVLTTAAYDEHKSIVLLAFGIMEKIVREYFPYITETEDTTFTDCVNCLIAFTTSRSNKDVSLSAIGFLRHCAIKLAEGDFGLAHKIKDKESSGSISPSLPPTPTDGKGEDEELVDKDDHLYFWFPLLAGLAELSFDPRPEIRKTAVQILFDMLRNYGHHFSLPLWERIFESVLFHIFDNVSYAAEPTSENSSREGVDSEIDFDQDSWLSETCTLSLELIVDLFVQFYSTVHPLLKKVLALLVGFVKRPHQSLAGIGIAAFVRLISHSGDLFSKENWVDVVFSLKEAAESTLPDFSFVLDEDSSASNNEESVGRQRSSESTETDTSDPDTESSRTQQLYSAISSVKCRCAVQILLVQAVMKIYSIHRAQILSKNVCVLIHALRLMASNAHKINSDVKLCIKLQELGSIIQIQDPPLLRLETESYQTCLTLLQNLMLDKPLDFNDEEIESYLVDLCREVLKFYIETSSGLATESSPGAVQQWRIPLGSRRRKELSGRGPLIVATLQAMRSLTDASFERNLVRFFPLMSTLIGCEHGSKDVQIALSEALFVSVGPVLLQSC